MPCRLARVRTGRAREHSFLVSERQLENAFENKKKWPNQKPKCELQKWLPSHQTTTTTDGTYLVRTWYGPGTYQKSVILHCLPIQIGWYAGTLVRWYAGTLVRYQTVPRCSRPKRTAFEVADRRRGERTPSAQTSTRVAVRWRTARRGKKTLEREEESVVLRHAGISRTKTRTSFVCDARTEFLKI